MANVGAEELLQQHESLYKLVLVAAKRALEVSQGAPPLVETTQKQPGTIALEEIRQGKVSYRVLESAKDAKKNHA